MNIAMIEEDLSVRTGSRRFVYETTLQLQELGHTVKIFTTELDKKNCFPEFLSLPVEVVSNNEFQSKAIRTLNRTLRLNLDYYWTRLMAILEIGRIIGDLEPDAAIFNYCGSHWLDPYFHHLKSPVGVVCLHVTPPASGSLSLPFQNLTWSRRFYDNFKKIAIKKWRDTSLKNLGLIITHSRYLLEQAIKQDLIGSRKSAIVPLGVDHSKFFPTGEEEPFALYVGRIHPYKSIELAIMAMKNSPPDTSLIIAGDLEYSHLSYKERLENIAKRIGISNRFKIILFPTTSQLVRLMQRCSVLLFPSIIDTFGLVILEAMACGKPVIACRRGGVSEILENTGPLLEPNVLQWRNTVKRVLSNSNLRQKMGRRALERSKLYSWQNTTCSLINMIENDLG